ncbi:hypothetical protein V865_005751 [Kwoniella europaea PYCC6329]|uniref:GDP/GTP exchange factor Sec2 N-terminal domain-containing protein n=1 Tax=Kwoniella europaea PYCC6329 TaxID=1423913 RepID=A0AAX4KPX6_9TREE
MSESHQDKVEEKRDEEGNPQIQDAEVKVETTEKEEGKDESENVVQDDKDETSMEVSVAVADAKAEVDSKSEQVKDVESQPQRAREKPSPLTLPTDLLNTHEADALHPPDSPTTSLITSLRTQLSLLSDQSIQLNQKLISSISKSADLEDELHELRAQHRSLTDHAGELEKEKNKWEESMNTGLLVERSQIKDEMQKLAQGLVEEERRRGTAEEKRREVENEVDDLTAKLFDQANAMVATERMSRAEAEARLKSTEENLAAAEAAVRDMQLHLQSLPPSAVQPSATSLPPHTAANEGISSISMSRKYLSSHVPYSEFLNFIQHLRTLRPIKETSKNTFPPPLITNLLTQPFLARTIVEDNDPTLRLDIAPDLSWLSRRSVSQAIISGDLIVEPVSTATLLSSTSSSIQEINCSLCGKSIFNHQQQPHSPAGTSHFGPPPVHPQRNSNSTTSRFSLKPFFATTTSSPATNSNSTPNVPSPSQSPISSPAIGSGGSVTSVYVFRIAKPQLQTGSNSGDKGDSKLYPLCRTGWCLERMRATCALWHFVRTGVIHVIWHGDDGSATTSTTITIKEINQQVGLGSETTKVNPAEQGDANSGQPTISNGNGEEQNHQRPPPLPQRKKSSWALGFKLSDKSTGGWTRGWKSSGGTTNSPPGSPGTGEEKRRDSVGSLGAERDENGRVQTAGGLGLGEALNIDEKEKEKEKEAPVIQEPSSPSLSTENEKDQSTETEGKQDEDSPKSGKEQEQDGDGGGEGETGMQVQPPPLSRATSNISSINTSETGFHTPKGGQADLPSEDGNDNIVEEEDVKRDEQSTPHPPSRVDTETKTEDKVIELASPASGTASPSRTSTGAPPPIPRRAAGRNRLSQLSGGTSTPVTSQPPVPVKDRETNEKQDEDEDELSILRELRDELEQRKSGDVSRDEKVDENVQDKQQNKNLEVVNPQDDQGENGHKDKDQKEDVEEEPPFTPVNLDEKFPLSPLQQQTFPSSSTSRPNSQSAPAAPPPLPPRHPRTPVLQLSNSTGTEGEKRYFTVGDKGNDNWEGKAWEKIVKLKEEMWKSRIGVLDE